jgi:hypothetical protein
MNPTSLVGLFLAYANQLKFKNLFLLILCLFVVDLLVPDMIPMVDEVILGLLTIFLANWKKEKDQNNQGTTIEGEIINKDD